MIKNKNRRFPLFINTENLEVLVIGSGNIATRRVNTLLQYDFKVTVIGKNLTEQLRDLVKDEKIFHIDEYFNDTHIQLKPWFLVVGCTNDEAINTKVYTLCKERNILVNCCDNKELCDFFFPAVFIADPISGGLVGDGSDHHLVSKVASEVRNVVTSIVNERNQ